MPATAATTAPPVVVFNIFPEPIELIAKLVVVACEVVAKRVVEKAAIMLPKTLTPALSVPKLAAEAKRLVDEAVVEKKLLEVACWSEVLPSTVSAPLALSEPPTLRIEPTVVELVTAKVPVLVAPVVVRPPLNCVSVEVALPASWKGYAAAIDDEMLARVGNPSVELGAA